MNWIGKFLMMSVIFPLRVILRKRRVLFAWRAHAREGVAYSSKWGTVEKSEFSWEMTR